MRIEQFIDFLRELLREKHAVIVSGCVCRCLDPALTYIRLLLACVHYYTVIKIYIVLHFNFSVISNSCLLDCSNFLEFFLVSVILSDCLFS